MYSLLDPRRGWIRDPGFVRHRSSLAIAHRGRSIAADLPVLRRWCLLLLVAVSVPAHAHWPDQQRHEIADLGQFAFEAGGKISNLRMSYVVHGTLNAAKDNAILFQHGFGANHHLFDHMIGPGRPLDTNKYFVVCPDALGATHTTFEHSISPTSSGLGMQFPFYNGRDMVRAQHKLLTEALGIRRLLAITGISSGADHSLQFAISYPDFASGILPVVGGTPATTQARLFGSLMVSIIESCDGWNGGNYVDNPRTCASNALSVLMPYFYTRDWWEHNVDTPEAFTRWRNSWGAYYLDVQDTRDLYYRALAGGRGWLGDTPGFDGNLNAALASIKARTLFILSPQDLIFPPQHAQAYVEAIPAARVEWIDSPAGHLICCNADPNATTRMGEVIRAFLEQLVDGSNIR